MASFGVMGLSGGVEPVLLWENPNPNTSYSGGTITNYSKSQYPYVIVESKHNYASDDYHVTTIFDTTKSNPYGNMYWIGTSSENESVARNITINDNNLVLGYGYAINGSGLYNDNAIPLKVWGF